MKFHQLAAPFWVILLSCSFAQSYGRWERKIEVTVRDAFLDQRHITIECHSYANSLVEETPLVRDLLLYPKHLDLQYEVEKFRRDTVHRCFVVWQCEGAGKHVTSIFEAFSGSWDHDLVSLWDPEHKMIRYRWSFTESGLSLYSYSFGNYHLMKTLKSIQSIDVYVRNGLQHAGSVTIMYITCASNQQNRQDKVLASRECAGGNFAAWTVLDFDEDTVQVCKVEFSDKRAPIHFEAFLGKWHRDDSIWDEEKKERRYDWTVTDDGLFVYNFETKENELVRELITPN